MRQSPAIIVIAEWDVDYITEVIDITTIFLNHQEIVVKMKISI